MDGRFPKDSADRWAVAVDLGGTWVRAAAISEKGAIGPIRRRETLAARPQGEILADVVRLMGEAARDAEERKGVVAGAGIGIATALEGGVRTVPCPNLPTLGDLDLGDRMQALARMPVAVGNDASCFALGEWWMGAGNGCRHLCGITLGTGIGLGIVIAGRVHSGGHGLAGEIWRTPAGDGHLEDRVSGRAVEQCYSELSGRDLRGPEIAELAAAGDEMAASAFRELGRWLGMTVAFLVNALDPEVVVLGGSIAAAFDHFEAPVREALAETTSPEAVRLERSQLGESAALFGAARMLWHRLGDGSPA